MPLSAEASLQAIYDLLSSGNARISLTRSLAYVGARVFRSTTQQLTTAQLTKLSYDSVRWDTSGFWSAGSPTKLTVPVAGYYLVGAHTEFDVGSATKSRYTDIFYNNTTRVAEGSGGFATVATEGAECEAASIWKCVAGDFFEVRGYQNSGGNLNVLASDGISNEFWISFLGG